jgi:hypothetical protein
MKLVLVSDDDDGNRWARKTDPWTSWEAGKGGFPKLRDRCLLFIWLYLKGSFTAEDVSRLCADPELIRTFHGPPLGKSPWHRITDCQYEKWVDWVYDDEGRIVERMEDSGQPQGLRQITMYGRLVAHGMWANREDKR